MTFANATRGTPALSPAIQKTLTQTFWTVGVMLALTSIASFFALGLKLSGVAMVVLFVVSLGLLWATSKYRNSGIGLVLLAAFALLQGVIMGPILNHYLSLSGGVNLVLTAAGLTATATFACAGYAIVSRRDFSRMGSFLFAATIVLVVAMIVAIFIKIPMLTVILSAVMAVLFLLWLLYDVGQIVNGTETSYISASIGIFLDIVNLFTSILRILGFIGGDD